MAVHRYLKAQLSRELDRLELLLGQIEAVEAERDALLAWTSKTATPARLLDLKGVGPEFASVLWSEGLYRHFDNRRQVAACHLWATTDTSTSEALSLSGMQTPTRVISLVCASLTLESDDDQRKKASV